MLTLQNLTLAYGSHIVLRNLSATIETGGFYALMGTNGSGKTTLLRCCAGLLQPSAGRVLLADKAVTDYAAKERARLMALVSQQTYADFEFTAHQLVLMARNPYLRPLQGETRRDLDIVEQAMRQTHTWHLREAHPSEMSGGEQRRVMLARALAQQTPLLLLDEPLANLDIAHQFEIMELLRDINRQEDKTILLVIHDIDMARTYCPNLLLLHNGDLRYQGATAEGLTPDSIRSVFGIDAALTPDGHLSLSPLAPGPTHCE